MPQGKLKVKTQLPASAKVSKVSKKGSIRKAKPAVSKKKKMQKALETSFKQTVEEDIRAKAGMSSETVPSSVKAKGKKKK